LFIIDCPREGIRGNKAEWNSMLSRLRLLNNYMLRQLGYIGINAELCNLDSRNLYFINSLFPERNERELYLYSKRQGYESMGSFIAFCHTQTYEYLELIMILSSWSPFVVLLNGEFARLLLTLYVNRQHILAPTLLFISS
jgi:hypothetical protein